MGNPQGTVDRKNNDVKNLGASLALTPSFRFDPLLSSTVEGEKRIYKEDPLSLVQRMLLEGAIKLVGRKAPVLIKGKRFAADCSGTVRAIYYYAGIDLAMDFYRYEGSGTYRVFKALNSRGLLTVDKYARVGDIIFWDNSYDANSDGKMNDDLTHMAMVTAVYTDGSVDYIHFHYLKGNIIERMNLFLPDVYRKLINGKERLINSPMRAKADMSSSHGDWLSSQLFRCYGQAYLLEN
ncbi:MAG: CHAP domain-containing protein [Spirochaetales bacterium]|nr:CHAP domain-containing protein [Spirochaetales bacterium]